MTSSLSSSSSLSLQSLFSTYSRDELLEVITQETQQIRTSTTRRDAAFDALAPLVASGEAEETQIWNDFKISRRTRKSYLYPDHILEQREALKASERLSVALGEATVTITSHWEVRAL